MQRDISSYDFYSPKKFTRERIDSLRETFEGIEKLVSSRLSALYGLRTEINTGDLGECAYRDFLKTLHENDCLFTCECCLPDKKKTSSKLRTYMTPGLVITIISNMLGGGLNVSMAEEGYIYSDVEKALYRKITENILNVVSDSFKKYADTSFKVSAIDEHPLFSGEIGEDETVVVVTLSVDMTGISREEIKIVFPGNVLSQIFKYAENIGLKGKNTPENSGVILDHIRGTDFPVKGELGVVRLDLSDICNLRVGDVIDMNKSKDSKIKIFVGDEAWFTGTMGVHRKNVAVRIDERIRRNDLLGVIKLGYDSNNAC